MTVTDELLENNAEFARNFSKGDLPMPPAKGLAVVACMDARLNVYALLGLDEGEAHVIRNAGGVVSDDVLRSLVISQRLLGKEDDGEAAEASRAVADQHPVRVALASFGVVFLGEWGDITQITTANLAARYGDPVSVGFGALLALWSVAALALTVGRGLVQRIPARLVRRITGVILAVLAVLTLVEAIRS